MLHRLAQSEHGKMPYQHAAPFPPSSSPQKTTIRSRMKRRTFSPKPYLPLQTRTRDRPPDRPQRTLLPLTPQSPQGADVQSGRAPALINTCHDTRFAPYMLSCAAATEIIRQLYLLSYGIRDTIPPCLLSVSTPLLLSSTVIVPSGNPPPDSGMSPAMTTTCFPVLWCAVAHKSIRLKLACA